MLPLHRRQAGLRSRRKGDCHAVNFPLQLTVTLALWLGHSGFCCSFVPLDSLVHTEKQRKSTKMRSCLCKLRHGEREGLLSSPRRHRGGGAVAKDSGRVQKLPLTVQSSGTTPQPERVQKFV